MQHEATRHAAAPTCLAVASDTFAARFTRPLLSRKTVSNALANASAVKAELLPAAAGST